MLPAHNRLVKKEDFQKVCQKGSFFSFGGLSLKLIKNGLDETRVGFLAGKKVLKKASERNRVKRLLRGAFLSCLPEIKKGFDVVVFCRAAKENIRKECGREAVEKLLEKGKLLTRK